MRAFVTGGSGFVGRNLIEMLRARGHEVRALARSDKAAEAVRALGAEPVRGDLGSTVEQLEPGLRGCDWVFHAAATVEAWGTLEEFEHINVGGTERMLQAARTAGVKKFVHVSTEAVLVGGSPLVRVDETRPRPARPIGLYPITKGRAEERVLAANDENMTTVILRPRFIWGAGDTSLLPQIIEAINSGKFMWIDRGRFLSSTTHVKNVCHGLILGAEKGSGGEIYFITDGEPLEFRRMLGELLATQGVDAGDKSVPRWLAAALAAVVEGVWRLFGIRKQPPLQRMTVKLFGEEVTLVDEKARRELGYAPLISREAGLAEMRSRRAAQ